MTEFNLEMSQGERDQWFLRMYAEKLRDGTARTIDIPSVIAGVIEGIASRIYTTPIYKNLNCTIDHPGASCNVACSYE